MSRDEQFAAFAAGATPSLWRTAYLLTGDTARSEDLVQQALVKTYLAWSRVRVDDAAAYARRVLVNVHTDTWRRTRREDLVDDVPEPRWSTEQDDLAALLDRRTVLPALAALTERERAVVVLRYLVDLSEREIAAELGIAPGTVKSTAHRALRRMRTVLTETPQTNGSPR